MTLKRILAQAAISNAVQFEKFLTDHKVNNTWLDVCMTNYNQDYFNITLDDYENYNIIFCDGVFEA